MRWLAFAIALAACRGKRGDAEACGAPPAARTGQGTYYAADGTGTCSFDGWDPRPTGSAAESRRRSGDASPNDLMVAAMNAPDWNDSAWCGACLDVTGPNGDVVVRVVDECPGCATGDLDLSEQAFAAIASLSTGRIAISWHEVACVVTTPIVYYYKDGTSAYWTAIQLRETRYPIAMLETRAGSGAWQAIPRQDYNYFVVSTGLGAGPYALRVTDDRGQKLEDDAVPYSGPSTAQNGAAQFPICP
jgi:expansin (peptidoglycan-binding protein)